MTEQNLTDSQSDAVATAIREELARKRMSRQQLADMARISLSTLEKALAGQRPFTLATVVRLEEALKRDLRGNGSLAEARPAGIAPDTLGSYARASVKWIEGDYLTIRPSFSTPEAFYVYRTSIVWDGDKSHLVFRESERIDAAYTQEGDVSVPHQSGFVYLVTNKLGQYRLVILSKPTISGEMFGILTTLQSGRGPQLLPVATPIVLVPIKGGVAQPFGKVERGSPHHSSCANLIRRTLEEPFAMFGTSS